MDVVVDDYSWAGTSTIVDPESVDPCVICGEGPYREAEYHLHSVCHCGAVWYHPACTVRLLRYIYGAWVFSPICCKACTGASTFSQNVLSWTLPTWDFQVEKEEKEESEEEENNLNVDTSLRKNQKRKKVLNHRTNRKGRCG
jgi:hypothetical protein